MKVPHPVRLLLALLLSVACRPACADAVLSSAVNRVQADGEFELKLTVTNPTADPLVLDLSSSVHVKVDAGDTVATLDLTSDLPGEGLTVAPGTFRSVTLRGRIPADVHGVATVTPTGIETNPVVLRVDPAAKPAETQPRLGEAMVADKPPPLALSVYEPVYFIVGGDDGLNAKFQISFRYRMFDDQGRLAERLPWIDDLYFSYSQTSLWDLNELSKPFTDSSYRPRLFYANYDLLHAHDGLWRFGIESGLGHESNGKEGEESRSINIVYARPTLTFGDPEGWRLYFAPMIYSYLDRKENPDIAEYRGHVDFLAGIGSKGGWNLWTTLRKGTSGSKGSAEINLSYPLAKLSGGDLTGWLMLQYFGGYGESLIDYQRKLDSQWRLGLAVAL